MAAPRIPRKSTSAFAPTPDLKSQTLRVRERPLSRPATRLIYDVECGVDGCAVSLPDLLRLLKTYIARPIENDDVEPTLPLGLSLLLLRQGNKLCRSMEAESVPLGLWSLIEGLYVLASNGNPTAQRTLVEVGVHAAQLVTELSSTRTDDMAIVAMDCEEWPATVSKHPDWKIRNERMINAIRLGAALLPRNPKISGEPSEDQPYRHILHIYSNRLIDVLTAARGWTRKINKVKSKSKSGSERQGRHIGSGKPKQTPLGELEWLRNAADLAELDADCAMKWFEVGWQALKFLSDRNPQYLPGLANVGRYKTEYRGRRGRRTAAEQRADKNDGIKTRLKDIFEKRFGKVKLRKV